MDRGSVVDEVEPQIRSLLAQFPRMPATVIAERTGWTRSLTILKNRVRQLRPLFAPLDPADRVEYAPGEVAQCDLWFPPVPIPVGGGAERFLPVLAMTCGPSRVTDAMMIPSRQAVRSQHASGGSPRRPGSARAKTGARRRG